MDRFYLFELLLLLLLPPQLIRQHRTNDEVKNDRERFREREKMFANEVNALDEIKSLYQHRSMNATYLVWPVVLWNLITRERIRPIPNTKWKIKFFFFAFFLRTENANVKFSLRSFEMLKMCACVCDWCAESQWDQNSRRLPCVRIFVQRIVAEWWLIPFFSSRLFLSAKFSNE